MIFIFSKDEVVGFDKVVEGVFFELDNVGSSGDGCGGEEVEGDFVNFLYCDVLCGCFVWCFVEERGG